MGRYRWSVNKLLATYLNDHYAGATAGVRLAGRSAKRNRDSELGRFLSRLTEEIDGDRRALRSVMSELGVGVNRAKQVAALGSEALARLKPNRRLAAYSPLSRVIELELLELGITGKLAMWRVLVKAVDEPLGSADLPGLIERAESQRSEVERHRVQVAGEAFRRERPAAGRRSGPTR